MRLGHKAMGLIRDRRAHRTQFKLTVYGEPFLFQDEIIRHGAMDVRCLADGELSYPQHTLAGSIPAISYVLRLHSGP